MESQVKQAKATVNELHSLIKEMESAEPPVPQDSIMRAKGKALTARKTLGTAEFKLRDAKAKLEFFNYHKKQTSELGKKQRSLKNDFAQLDVSINKNANSSKEHQVVVKFYEKQVSIAKSALSNADKLMKAEGKAHENKVDMGNHFRSEVQDIKASIKNSKLPALQRQLKAAKKNLSEAKHRENNEKQQELKQKKQEKQEAARRKAEEQQEAAQRKARQHQPDQTRKHQAPTKPPAEQQKAAAPAQTNQQRTSNDSRAKRVVKAITPNMQNFLRGVKGMSATAVPLRTVMRMAQTPNDFKQALADIRESVRSNTIDKQTAARLRSQLCQQAATKMSNPDFVKKIDSVFVRHMMYGQHQEKMLDNYAASVETLAKRLPRG
ncbi:hypothetical protein [Endozoicomonas montiporae]|nr:hypothetical protein [Endozoicomonas montiporae]